MKGLGGFLLTAMMGSVLDWGVALPYLKTHIHKEQTSKAIDYQQPLMILCINIGLFMKLWLFRFLLQFKVFLMLSIVIIYSSFWILFAFSDNYPSIFYVYPPLIGFFIGLVFFEPLDQILISYSYMREKASCYTLSALGFGWLTFSTMTELTFNPNQSTNPDDLTFQVGCFFQSGLILIIGLSGIYFLYIKQTDEQEDKNIQRSFSIENYRIFMGAPLQVLKTEQFYFIWIQLFFFYNCSIGAIIYISQNIQTGEDQNAKKITQFQFLWLIVVDGISMGVGQLIPILFSIPLPQKALMALIQLCAMLSLTFVAYFDQSFAELLLTNIVQFILFGVCISFSMLIVANNYGWNSAVDILPFICTSICMSAIVSYAVHEYCETQLKAKGILLFNQIGLIIAFMINILYSKS